MPRIVGKGGIWTNAEDEVLKAAVMKYGKNQWSRISSLLVRKGTKQCKARWFEWLDPRIKKTEWTREEEEKLLHLAKIMPTQWRTIAPIVGRTAAQCLEHYEKLLDQAQDKDGDDKDDPRRLRPGEIDPNPESKPARPDAIDMDEDEKEMLSEARARLANTKGKKAKRKAREKQLAEAKRMAMLQRRRELKAAGIQTKKRVTQAKRKRGVDYLNEIPFQIVPPKGFHDTMEDKVRTKTMKKNSKFFNKTQAEIEGKRRKEIVEEERKKDLKRQKLHQKHNLKEHLDRVSRLNDPNVIRRRQKMVLPAPQISDVELEDIAKLGGLDAVVAMASSSSSSTGSGMLSAKTPTPMRAARTPLQQHNILQEASQLAALSRRQTPLKMGESTPLPTNLQGLTPQRRDVQTPNVIANQLRGVVSTPQHPSSTTTAAAAGSSSTMSSSAPPTPVRDDLSINQSAPWETTEDLTERKKIQKSSLSSLKDALSHLPKPNHEYAVVVPDLPDGSDSQNNNDELPEEDMEDILRKEQERQQAEREKELRLRSQVIQRSFPRPLVLQQESITPLHTGDDASLAHASKAIHKELLLLLEHDHRRFPPIQTQEKLSYQPLPVISEDLLNQAKELILQETTVVQEQHKFTVEQGVQQLQNSAESFVFDPSTAGFVHKSSATKKTVLASAKHELQLLQKAIEKETTKADKLESKVDILTKGYRMRFQSCRADLEKAYDNLVESHDDLMCFEDLLARESMAIPGRTKLLEEEVDALVVKERMQQQRYADLLAERAQLLQKLQPPTEK